MAILPFTFADGSQLDVIGASVLGADHQKKLRNNQDAFGWGYLNNPPAFVAIVADGCTNEDWGANEVGANTAVEVIKSSILQAIKYGKYPLLKNYDPASHQRFVKFWNAVADNFTNIFGEKLLSPMINPESKNTGFASLIKLYGLFTINGVLITNETFDFFSIGDGVLAANGQVFEFGKVYHSKPPFIMYRTVRNMVSFDKSDLEFKHRLRASDTELENFLIGTDGVSHLIEAAEKKIPDPTSDEKVGPLSQFWTEDIYFTAKNALSAKLTRINSEAKVARLDTIKGEPIARLEIHPGLLPDDTTLIVGRRIKR